MEVVDEPYQNNAANKRVLNEYKLGSYKKERTIKHLGETPARNLRQTLLQLGPWPRFTSPTIAHLSSLSFI